MTTTRLIETGFPLRETSAASLHEKNMRHGHISTLHLWPARRPLAASRAAVAAALIPDPASDTERAQFLNRLGGKLVPKVEAGADEDTDTERLVADGGILWWGHEGSADLAWFRERILRANGGRAPRVLDPFSGGGAIPLEAMRLGCEVTANDLSPVAWFLLRCSLDYPGRVGRERRQLPDFVRRDAGFMTGFLKAMGVKSAAGLRDGVARAAGSANADVRLIETPDPWEEADLGWHVRAWGEWVLAEARRELAGRYPAYAEWCAPDPSVEVERKPLRRLHVDADGRVSLGELNAGMTARDLRARALPRWVAKPTVAYLWARTITCVECRAEVPLLKTRWLANIRKRGKRVRIVLESRGRGQGVSFRVEAGVPVVGATEPARKAADLELGGGTMSGSGVKCPCCDGWTTTDEIRHRAARGGLGAVMTAVVVEGTKGKEYRDPTPEEIEAARIERTEVEAAFADVPFGIPGEPIPLGGSRAGGGSPFTTPQYGLTTWDSIFTHRQLIAMAAFTRAARRVREAARGAGYPELWAEALWAYLALANDRVADRSSTIAHWDVGRETIVNTFSGFRLPISWDFAECCVIGESTGSYSGAVEWIGKFVSHAVAAVAAAAPVALTRTSAKAISGEFDAIITDPPYYDAIPYSDLMDFFYVWLRRCLHGMSLEVDEAFREPVGPKWNHEAKDGELIDDASRFGGDREASKRNFEDGMADVFARCHVALRQDGILVIVFANKNPDAWETLVAALIRAGFVVDGSLPIQTEMGNRTRAQSSAALSSSVWLVCRKRQQGVRPEVFSAVLEQMQEKITAQMHRFWDAGITGPDFVWAATGPALEAFSRYPIVWRDTSASGVKEKVKVSEFLAEVRRIVVEFAVGRVLRKAGGEDGGAALDPVTTYYILHRDTFGMGDAPAGSCILYAMSCGLNDADLADRHDLIARSGGAEAEEPEEGDEEDVGGGGTGSKVRLKRWDQRRRRGFGTESVAGRGVPVIDRVHRAMQFWREGEVARLNGYLDGGGVGRDPLFRQVLQALIELAGREGRVEEKTMLESLSNHMRVRQGVVAAAQPSFV